MKRFPKDISSFDPNDSRLHWKKVTQADGFTLRQAMLYFDSKNRHQEFIAKEKDSGGLVDNGSFIGADFRIKGNSFKRLQDELVGNLI